jgi:phage shock protein A
MGTFSRIRYVIAANLNALLEKAEDPEKLLRALIREMEDAGEDAREAAAELLAEQQHLVRRAASLESEVTEWQERAERAVAAERDELARAALKARTELAAALDANRDEQTSLEHRRAQLETDMTTLKAKLSEAKARLKSLQQRPAIAGGVAPAGDERLGRNERKLRQAMNRFDRLQGQVERLEARVRSYEVGGVSPSPGVVEADSDPAVEEELAALKAKLNKAPVETTENREDA